MSSKLCFYNYQQLCYIDLLADKAKYEKLRIELDKMLTIKLKKIYHNNFIYLSLLWKILSFMLLNFVSSVSSWPA